MTFFKVTYTSDSLSGLASLVGLSTSSSKSESVSTIEGEGVLGPPPSPQSSEVSENLGSDPDQLAPPPFPISDSMVEGGSSIQSEAAPPPEPNSLMPNTVGDQTEEEVDPPPGLPKRETKRSKEVSKS